MEPKGKLQLESFLHQQQPTDTTMRDVFILGAGFSKAVNDAMPVMAISPVKSLAKSNTVIPPLQSVLRTSGAMSNCG